MTTTDFTLTKNPQIKAYFNGSDEYIPVSELLYLHEHPLIKESFLREIEALIDKSSDCLVINNVKGGIVDKFITSTQKLGALLPDVNRENAPYILKEIRIVYKLCKGLLSNFNFK